jgi:hypothetical protein
VADLLDDVADPATTSAPSDHAATNPLKTQLGHTSKTVTERHYINRKLVVPDYRAATGRLAPGSGSGHRTGPAK